MTGGTSEAQTAVATTEGSSSSKPRQRSRKGKESGLPSESTSKDSAQIEDAPRESQTRARKGRKAHTKRGDTEASQQDAAQPEAGSQPPPAGSSKNPRPKARPLNQAKRQVQQTVDETHPVISEVVPNVMLESAHASSPPTQGVEDEVSREDTLRAPRKRPAPTSPVLNKRRKTSDQRVEEADNVDTGKYNIYI